MPSDEMTTYIRKRLSEGSQPYGEGGVAGEVARKFNLKPSSAGFRVWEILRQSKTEPRRQSLTTFLPPEEEDVGEQEEEIARGGFTLEDELQRQVAKNIGLVEKGLVLAGQQVKTEAGIIDVTARDPKGATVIIELKPGLAEEKALVQLLRYVGHARKANPNKEIRGILVAHDFEERLKYSVSMIPNVRLKTYEIEFEIGDVLS
jgi:hypothetical protein